MNKSLHSRLAAKALIAYLAILPVAHADWVLVDNFSTPDLSAWNSFLRGEGDPGRVDPEDPPRITVVPDPAGSDNTVLEIHPGRLILNISIGVHTRLLPEEAIIVDPFPETGFATWYFRALRPLVEGRPGQPSLIWGLSKEWTDEVTGEPRPPAIYGDNSVTGRFNTDGRIDAHSGAYAQVSDPVDTDTWYEIWYVIDHGTNSYRMYIRGGSQFSSEEPTLVFPMNEGDPDGVYRAPTFDDLKYLAFLTSTGSDDNPGGLNPSYVDDIYIDPTGINLTTPVSTAEPEPFNPFAGLATDEWTELDGFGMVYAFSGSSDWIFHEVVGFLYTGSSPWMHHQTRGWLWSPVVEGDLSAGSFFHSPALGWVKAGPDTNGKIVVLSSGESVDP